MYKMDYVKNKIGKDCWNIIIEYVRPSKEDNKTKFSDVVSDIRSLGKTYEYYKQFSNARVMMMYKNNVPFYAYLTNECILSTTCVMCRKKIIHRLYSRHLEYYRLDNCIFVDYYCTDGISDIFGCYNYITSNGNCKKYNW